MRFFEVIMKVSRLRSGQGQVQEGVGLRGGEQQRLDVAARLTEDGLELAKAAAILLTRDPAVGEAQPPPGEAVARGPRPPPPSAPGPGPRGTPGPCAAKQSRASWLLATFCASSAGPTKGPAT